MYLIAKNKIAHYLQQHPEAATAFLTWLKEYPEQEARRAAHMSENNHQETLINGLAGIGLGDYQVEYSSNLIADATYILWVGSRDELHAREEEKLKQIEKENPGSTRVKVVTVTLIPPPPIPMPEGTVHSVIVTPQIEAAPVKQQSEITETPYIETDADLKTTAQYEKALARAAEIFESLPGSPEFDELCQLASLIDHYEQGNLELPELKMLDVVKYKMGMFEITGL